jgi:hypothetical protein
VEKATGEVVGVVRGPESVAATGQDRTSGPEIGSTGRPPVGGDRLWVSISDSICWGHPQQSGSNCRYGLCVGTTTEMLKELR